MSRPRDVSPGIVHVTAHAVDANELFRDDIDRLSFLTQVASVVARRGWTCIAVTLMTTHYHLLVETYDESLPVGMHQLNFRYAARFNSRHRRRGHVFEARYSSRPVETEAHLLAAYRYVARNAVEAGLCTQADAWAWCSYGALVTRAESFTFVDASRVVDWFGNGTSSEAAIARLRVFVDGVESVTLP